ncbi:MULTISPECIES: hypothetical protein [Catenuloplanes]|uniref:S-methylmethionine-dependent homocysteine/selenocysteine methylase n=1 Tax=Catenuloplanes niger TaxID=587534 RepID=A0AAE4A0C1_9ACTN|nr:hypothetical protein [Catenuloplanes niger]MDR7328307.1 S-methylmethionine-dependent homocysteine/selenocysteine methylase [Catenuloplanes niger]
MSSGGVHVTPESLEHAGQRLGTVAERFASALSEFQAEIAGFGRPWGEDDIGQLIGIAHDEVSAVAFECYRDALDEIAAAGVDLAGMAQLYTVAEEAILRRMSTLREAL